MVRLQAWIPFDFWVLFDPRPLFLDLQKLLNTMLAVLRQKWLWNFDPIVTEIVFSRSRLRTGSLTLQKTCTSDFSSSASAESRNLNGNQACSATESALKRVDLSRIGQIPVNCTFEVSRSTNWKFEKKQRICVLRVRSSRGNKPVIL